MSAKVDQKEYLKKYLSGGKKDEKKKKKKRTKVTGVGMKIIDADDVMDISKMRMLESHELDLFGDREDAPQIAGIIDDRPEEIKKLENFSSDKWKVINRDDGYNASITIEQISNREKSHRMIDNNSPPNSDSDLSPDRNSNKKIINKGVDSFKSDNKNDKIINKNSDSDLSPPRNHKDDQGRSHKSKKNTGRGNSDSDLSPARNDRINMSKKGDRSQTSSKISKKDVQLMYLPNSDSDLSPPRSKKDKINTATNVSSKNKSNSSHHSKIHYKNHNSDSDLSPPRTALKKENISGRVSPDNKRKIEDLRLDKKKEGRRKKSRWNDTDNDDVIVLSDSEKNKTTKSDSKDSHQRRNKDLDSVKDPHHSDRRRNSDKRFDLSRIKDERNRSPIDKKKYNDNSRRNTSDRERSHRSDHRTKGYESQELEDGSRNRKMDKTLDGKRAGLQDARQLKTENDEFRRKESELFGKLSEEFTGKNAQTIKRDMRTGKPRDTEEEKRQQLEKEEKQKVTDGKYSRWGKGLKQIEEQEAKVKDYLHEASKPLARFKDDQDLDRALMGRERTGDPMLEYMRKIDQEKMKTDGFEAPPIYKGPYPPNRFDIRPGHRWDGVDRSNGHEKNYFQAKSNRKALDAESYKWSTEDM